MNGFYLLTASQVRSAAEMLAGVFYDDPVYVYFMPDARERTAKLHHTFTVRLRHCLAAGEAYATSPDMEGIAMWLPPGYAKLTAPKILLWGTSAIFSSIWTSSGRTTISRQMAFSDFLSSLQTRVAPFPHWYLALVGVGADYQGRGYASGLLRPMFSRMDRERLPCYLDTQKEDNIPLYEHLGFRVIADNVVPGTDIHTWSMLRGD